ncbi:PG0541 family transporter-associated protein [Breznakiellaceae bacterium SP9]
MLRIEIVANHSVEENIMDALKDAGVAKHFTKYPTVFGVGNAGPHMGDAIWPEENFALVIWCEYAEAVSIEEALAAVKKQFTNEGIKIFGLEKPEPQESAAKPITPASPLPTVTSPPASAAPEPSPPLKTFGLEKSAPQEEQAEANTQAAAQEATQQLEPDTESAAADQSTAPRSEAPESENELEAAPSNPPPSSLLEDENS